MATKKTQDTKERKNKSKGSAFIPFAIIVFSALGIGLLVILMRSNA